MCSHLLFSCWASATYMFPNKVFYCFSHTGFAVGAQVLWKPLLSQSQNGRVKDISIIVGRVDLGKSSITGHLVYEWGSIIKQAMESFTRRLLKWEQVPSGMPTSWTNLNVSMRVVLHAQLPVEIYNEQMLCDYPWCSRTQILSKNFTTGLFQSDLLSWMLLLVLMDLKLLSPKKWEALTACRSGLEAEWETANDWCQQKQIPPSYLQAKKIGGNGWGNKQLIKNTGNNPDIVACASISGWNVDNILEKIANMPWFKRWGCKWDHTAGSFGLYPVTNSSNDKPS